MIYRDLPIYQRSRAFSIKIVKDIEGLPRNRTLNILASQLIRSVTSIPANLAEGSVARSRREFIQFIQISYKSSVESQYWLDILERVGYNLDREQECEEIAKILCTILKRTKQRTNY